MLPRCSKRTSRPPKRLIGEEIGPQWAHSLRQDTKRSTLISSPTKKQHHLTFEAVVAQEAPHPHLRVSTPDIPPNAHECISDLDSDPSISDRAYSVSSVWLSHPSDSGSEFQGAAPQLADSGASPSVQPTAGNRASCKVEVVTPLPPINNQHSPPEVVEKWCLPNAAPPVQDSRVIIEAAKRCEAQSIAQIWGQSRAGYGAEGSREEAVECCTLVCCQQCPDLVEHHLLEEPPPRVHRRKASRKSVKRITHRTGLQYMREYYMRGGGETLCMWTQNEGEEDVSERHPIESEGATQVCPSSQQKVLVQIIAG